MKVVSQEECPGLGEMGKWKVRERDAPSWTPRVAASVMVLSSGRAGRVGLGKGKGEGGNRRADTEHDPLLSGQRLAWGKARPSEARDAGVNGSRDRAAANSSNMWTSFSWVSWWEVWLWDPGHCLFFKTHATNSSCLKHYQFSSRARHLSVRGRWEDPQRLRPRWVV